MNWQRRTSPETRWILSDCVSRLGRWRGCREWARRQVSYWCHRVWFRYWSRTHYPPGDNGRSKWYAGRRTEFARTAWYQSRSELAKADEVRELRHRDASNEASARVNATLDRLAPDGFRRTMEALEKESKN